MGVKAKLRKNRKNGISSPQKQHSLKPCEVERNRKEIIDLQRQMVSMCVFHRHQLSEVVWDAPYLDIISTYKKYDQLGIFLRIGDEFYFVKAEDLRETQLHCFELLKSVKIDPYYYMAVGFLEHSNVYRVYLTVYENSY